MDWQKYLQEMLFDVKKVAVLGIGSILCGDDAAGMEIIARLEEQFSDNSNILLMGGSTAPENFTGEIKKFSPDHLLVVDAAFMQASPGTIAIVDPADIDGMGFSTHMLPLSVMLAYVQQYVGCEYTCIGIQPACTDFGSCMGEKMTCAVEELCSLLKKIFDAK